MLFIDIPDSCLCLVNWQCTDCAAAMWWCDGGGGGTVGDHTTPINPKAKMPNWTVVLLGVCLFLPADTPELIPNQFVVKFYPILM